MSKIFSLESFKQQDPGFKFTEVEAHGGEFRLRSLDSLDMIDWIEKDNLDDGKRRHSGLRLAVRSMVDADGNKVPGWTEAEPEGQREEFFRLFLARDANENAKVIAAAYEVNGMRRKKPAAEPEKSVLEQTKNV